MPGLNLVVAMAIEAAPLVAHYRLQPVKEMVPYPLFTGDGVQLVVSGMGRVNAASAVTWLAAAGKTPFRDWSRNQAWLNLGIGGSSAFDQNALVLAEQVEEAASGRRWPVVPPAFSSATAGVMTVDRPQTVYDRPVVYEMEASGFLVAARRVGRQRRIQVAKIISDGPGSPVAALRKAGVKAIIERALPQIDELVERMRAVECECDAGVLVPEPEAFLRRWRFSVEQICILHRLLRQAHRDGVAIEIGELATVTGGAGLLQRLEQRLKERSMRE